jgi:Mn-dependent DtxR family transcriptional regulator
MKGARKVFNAIKDNPGLRWSQIAALLDIPRHQVEDIIWELWRNGKIQCEPNSTLRITRKGEKVFRHFAP